MPTPFTHLHIAQRLLRDSHLPAAIRAALHDQLGPFLLGNVAADARSSTGQRANTHFYSYDQVITRPVWLEMAADYPALVTSPTPAQRVFMAGYVAHLSVDQVWTSELVQPHIVAGDWGDLRFRFYVMHLLLIVMDERDLSALEDWQPAALHTAEPQNWLPFISDADLAAWRDLIHQQITPGGVSLTLDICGERVRQTPDELRAVLDSPTDLRQRLWDNITPDAVAVIEDHMYTLAREQLTAYWTQSESR